MTGSTWPNSVAISSRSKGFYRFSPLRDAKRRFRQTCPFRCNRVLLVPYKGQQLFEVRPRIRSTPAALSKLHPPTILRGRWITWLSAFSETRNRARRAKKVCET